jgi:RND family efflux transporter MFP subunit
VRLWADPKQVIQGTVREVSPIADPATRTYAIKIAIPDDTPNVKLGMTAYASFISKTSDDAIKVPLTALLRVQDHSAVWVVEGGAVRQVAVQITGQHGNEVWIQGALRGGQQVVTAGVNQLKPGQKVTILNAPEGSLPAPKGALNQSLASNADSVATAAGGAAR